jgi:predicted amidophosphoribosyltransferase
VKDRKGRKQCPKCGRKRVFTGKFCVPCEKPVLKRRMKREHIPGILKHLESLGIKAEAIETSDGNIVIRKVDEAP